MPIRASINPELLTWARESCRMDVEYASGKLGISEEALRQWENGQKSPTIRQLRNLARVYRVNFGALFLPSAPDTFTPPVKDYRLHKGVIADEIDPEIAIDLRMHLNSRGVALELERELENPIPSFELTCSVQEEPSTVASRIRNALNIPLNTQKQFRSSRVAFNAWREALGNLGVLVIQSSKVDLRSMRGYSVFFDEMPLIVVNRKDAYSARSFTLLHELTHLLLRSSGLCDLNPETGRAPEEQKLEIFCNAVASQTLVPDHSLLSDPRIRGVALDDWNDEILGPISRDFGVSREVILRKLLDHGRTSRAFYLENRDRYKQEALERKRRGTRGFVPPSTDVVSAKGKKYVSLVLDAMHSNVITSGDAADVLGVKTKHFAKIEANLGRIT